MHTSLQRQLAPPHDALIDLAALTAGERVVDVACGAGLVTFAAAEAVGITGMVFGIDVSAAMVQQGRARARERGRRYVWFERGAAERLPLPGGVFDAALCAFGLMFVADPHAALREMARVLADGGRAVAAVRGVDDRLASAFRAVGFDEVTTTRIDEFVIVHGRKAR